MRPDEPVRMSWRDRDETARAEGRAEDGQTILPRQDAEQLLHWLLRCPDERFDFSIDPWPPAASAAAEPPTTETPVGWIKLLGFLGSCAEFAWKHRTATTVMAIVAGELLLAALAINLPTAHLRTIPLVLLVLLSIVLGYMLQRPSPSPPETA